MNILQSFKMALRSIRGNKMRSFLTMLGIIIGVASVIILVSVVNGYMNTILSGFSELGVNQINVSVTNTSSRVLEAEEMYEFFDEHADRFSYLSPVVNVSMPLKNGNETMRRTQRRGYSEDYMKMKEYEPLLGRGLSYADCEAQRKVAVLGYYTASELFGSPEEALGERIKIGDYSFKVIGVVERQDEAELSEGGEDDFVWVPYTVATKMARSADIGSYVIASKDTKETEACTETIEAFLQDVYKNDNFYSVTANAAMLDEMNRQIGMMSGMLGGIAGISLLVAGVGVMNIMLVSVTERTREIGIRKALGAKRSLIMQQFVIEAAVTSSIGGIIGILLGALLTGVIGALIGITAVPTLSAVLISFGVSVGIGLLFGYLPASRAANLSPIDALRSE